MHLCHIYHITSSLIMAGSIRVDSFFATVIFNANKIKLNKTISEHITKYLTNKNLTLEKCLRRECSMNIQNLIIFGIIYLNLFICVLINFPNVKCPTCFCLYADYLTLIDIKNIGFAKKKFSTKFAIFVKCVSAQKYAIKL